MSPAVTALETALALIGQMRQTIDSARHSPVLVYVTSLFHFHNHALAETKWQPGCLTRVLGSESQSQRPILYVCHVYL